MLFDYSSQVPPGLLSSSSREETGAFILEQVYAILSGVKNEPTDNPQFCGLKIF